MTAMSEIEVWKSINGFEGLYEVSNLGRVRSVERVVVTQKCGRYPNGRQFIRKSRVLKPGARPAGYLFVGLYKGNTKLLVSIHKLVMDQFLGPIPDGLERCHNDGNPRNNRLSNLRYDTSLANHGDRRKHGTLPCGSAISWAKLDEESVRFIRSAYAAGQKQKDLAKQFGVNPSVISAAVTGRKWAHVL